MTKPKPSVDLGYPTPAHGRVPSFRTVEEEAKFWDTHSVTDLGEEFQPATLSVGKNLATAISVRLSAADRAELERRARAKGVGPSTLIRMWVKDHMRDEADAESGARRP